MRKAREIMNPALQQQKANTTATFESSTPESISTEAMDNYRYALNPATERAHVTDSFAWELSNQSNPRDARVLPCESQFRDHMLSRFTASLVARRRRLIQTVPVLIDGAYHYGIKKVTRSDSDLTPKEKQTSVVFLDYFDVDEMYGVNCNHYFCRLNHGVSPCEKSKWNSTLAEAIMKRDNLLLRKLSVTENLSHWRTTTFNKFVLVDETTGRPYGFDATRNSLVLNDAIGRLSI